MKKKFLSLAVAFGLLATAAIGGTLAYFTDTDKDINVMTSGNVKIVQNEEQRGENGAAEAFENNKVLLPAVYDGTLAYDGTFKATNGDEYAIWDETVNNEVDKFITVTNTGTQPAYIRTIVLMENTENNAICEKIHGLWNNSDGQYRQWVTNADGTEVQVEFYGTKYSVAVCTYNTALDAGETSAPSLMQIFLDPSATNDWYDLLQNGEFSIIAISQAAQKEGFEDKNDNGTAADEALNAAFGEVTADNVTKWFNDANVDTTGAANVIATETPAE